MWQTVTITSSASSLAGGLANGLTGGLANFHTINSTLCLKQEIVKGIIVTAYNQSAQQAVWIALTTWPTN